METQAEILAATAQSNEGFLVGYQSLTIVIGCSLFSVCWGVINTLLVSVFWSLMPDTNFFIDP